jgi:hypothetical protein
MVNPSFKEADSDGAACEITTQPVRPAKSRFDLEVLQARETVTGSFFSVSLLKRPGKRRRKEGGSRARPPHT